MRRRSIIAPFLAGILAFSSCSGSREYRAVVALDEAFTAAYPSLAAAIERPTAFEGRLGTIVGKRLKPLRITLNQGAGLALDAVRQAQERSSRPVALVASPLVASALIGGGVWKGEPPLLVPEWRGKPASGMRTAATDPLPAYRRAGAALGEYLAALSSEGGSPCCGILYAEGPSRPRSALQAFADAYNQASGGARLLVRELTQPSADPAPSPSPSPSQGSPGEEAAAQASDAAAAKPLGAEDAVKEMLGSDIRALFIALGPDTAAAAKAASRPGLVLGADSPDPDALKALAFRIAPDSEALVEALSRELKALGHAPDGPEGIGPSETAVPARLVIGSSASAIRAGGRSLASILRGAAPEGER